MYLQTVILAAGKGTRMQSAIPKPLIPVQGTPMLTRVLQTLRASHAAHPPVVVVGDWTTAIQDAYGDAYTYAIQTDISGTATAVQAAIPYLDTTSTAAPVLILNADHPFLQPETVARIADVFSSQPSVLAMCTVTVPDFADWRQPFAAFGRVVRSPAGVVERIIEVKNATTKEQAIREVNPALYCVNAAWLAETIGHIQANPLTGEYYLTDLVELAVASGYELTSIPLAPEEAIGLNSQADIENAAAITL